MKGHVHDVISGGLKPERPVLQAVKDFQNRAVIRIRDVQIPRGGEGLRRDRGLHEDGGKILQIGNGGILTDKNNIVMHKRIPDRIAVRQNPQRAQRQDNALKNARSHPQTFSDRRVSAGAFVRAQAAGVPLGGMGAAEHGQNAPADRPRRCEGFKITPHGKETFWMRRLISMLTVSWISSPYLLLRRMNVTAARFPLVLRI